MFNVGAPTPLRVAAVLLWLQMMSYSLALFVFTVGGIDDALTKTCANLLIEHLLFVFISRHNEY